MNAPRKAQQPTPSPMSPREQRFWRWVMVLLALGFVAAVCKGAWEVQHVG